jgi:hypothetical protein
MPIPSSQHKGPCCFGREQRVRSRLQVAIRLAPFITQTYPTAPARPCPVLCNLDLNITIPIPSWGEDAELTPAAPPRPRAL